MAWAAREGTRLSLVGFTPIPRGRDGAQGGFWGAELDPWLRDVSPAG